MKDRVFTFGDLSGLVGWGHVSPTLKRLQVSRNRRGEAQVGEFPSAGEDCPVEWRRE